MPTCQTELAVYSNKALSRRVDLEMEISPGLSRNEQMYLTCLKKDIWLGFKRNDKELVQLSLFKPQQNNSVLLSLIFLPDRKTNNQTKVFQTLVTHTFKRMSLHYITKY